ncbi:MAG: glycoside hydrolase family 88 protein, partial [Prevotellaceae bacterium]|nr:glycoside hydrolase family 88 protein [Prevotellaceae bacterium]
MKHIKLFLALLMFPMVALADAWETEYKQIEQSIKQPEFKDKDYSITAFGASPNATAAVNQKAINKAIAACSKAGGGRVIVPEGTFNTGAITLLSKVNLHVEKGGVLLFAFQPELYPIVPTRWEGLDCYNLQPCVYAYKQTDIAITGEGTIDGGGENATWWKWCGKDTYGWKKGEVGQNQGARARLLKYAEDGVDMKERRFTAKDGLRPQLINLYSCENILIENVTLLRSPFWVIHPLLSKNITVDGVYIWNEGPNGDGCDPEACENVLIQNCTFHTGDDCIAIKSGRNNDGRLWNTPSKNIIIRNCKMEDGHGGVVIGSEISGGCQNVYAENCHMDSPDLDRVLRIKTNNCRGGLIENINMRNVTVGQCREAVLKINLDYEPKELCYRGFQPTVRKVYMENVTCQKSNYGVLIIGLNEIENVYDITVKDCKFEGVVKKPVQVTGKTRNVKYDNLFINGQLILTDADKPYKNYSQWMTWSEMKRNPKSFLLDFSKKPKWSYVMGIEMESMLDTYLRYKDEKVIEYLCEYPDTMIDADGNITGYKLEDYNLDNVRTAKFIYRMNRLFPAENLDKAINTLFSQLEQQPRTNEGVWWHKAIYANQVWLDGIFMGLPFYSLAAPSVKGMKKAQEKYWKDAIDQIVKTDKRTYDEKTNLWKHAWDETHTAFWADKKTGQSKHTWARALGWYVMAMTEVLDVLPADYPGRNDVVALLEKTMKSVVDYQDKKTGVWYDVLDVKDERNYLEATASSMFAYVMLKGV